MFEGVRNIDANQPKAQAVKGKERTGNCRHPRGPASFTTQLAKAMKAACDAGYLLKVELGPRAEFSDTVLDEWKRSRAR